MSEMAVEEALRVELARGDVALATTRPVLRYMLATDDRSLFSDEVIARIRAMLGHVASQLLMAQAEVEGIEERDSFAQAAQDDLAQLLFEDVAFLAHAHALVMEARLAEDLRERAGIDSVLSPLLQDLAAASDTDLASGAIAVLAAQARFLQQCRRMELPLQELPADLFHQALILLRQFSGESASAEATEQVLRTGYDESSGRLAQIARLLMILRPDLSSALAVERAGLGIFASALATATGQDRDVAILTFGEDHLARLALSLCAAGLDPLAVEQQFLHLHPDIILPMDFDSLPAERAAALLAGSQPEVPF